MFELRLTNRGGGIDEAVMLNHIAEKGQARCFKFCQAHADRRDG